MPIKNTITDLSLVTVTRSINSFSCILYILAWIFATLACSYTNAQLTTTAPILLNSTGVNDSKADGYPQIACDNDGNCVAVWTSEENLNGEIGEDWDVCIAYSWNSGLSWSDTSVLNSNASDDKYDDGSPSIATNGNGIWIATWFTMETENRSATGDMDIYFSRSTDNGATWSAALNLNSPGMNDSKFDMNPIISSDEKGGWMVAWGARTDEGFKTLFARSTDDGRTWATPAHHSPREFSEEKHRGVILVPAGPNRWLSYWSSRADKWNAPEADIVYFQYSADLGVTWSPTKKFSTQYPATNGFGGFPNIKINDNGKWVAAWDYRDRDDPRLDEEEILVANSRDQGATWSTPIIINKKVESKKLRDRFVQLSFGSGNSLVALWDEKTSTGAYADPVNLKASHSADAGKTWSTPIALLPKSDESGVKTLPKNIAYAGSNNWVVVWNGLDERDGSKDADIFVTTLKIQK
jgi:hypothetical protein